MAVASHSTQVYESKADTMERVAVSMTSQDHEDDVAELVVLSKPGLGKLMGSMHPAGALYEKPINLRQVFEQHATFRKVLEENGVRVIDIREMLLMDAETSVGARLELEEYAMRCLKYELAQETTLDEKDAYYLTDDYKRTVVEAMSAEQLLDVIITNPTVSLVPSYRDTHFTATYSFRPLSNLVFMRDQQITTRRGIVLGRLTSAQRQNEVALTRFCFSKMGFTIAGEIPEEGRLEGGDYFPAGEDLCFIGIGLRSNMAAVQYMLDNDLFGTRRVAVVRDDFDMNQDRMHLDCVFNIISRDICLMYADMIGKDSKLRRLVDEYELVDGVYKKVQSDIEFSEYVTRNNYHIIEVSHADQLAYGCNALNLGNSNIIAVHPGVARQIARCKHFKGKVRCIDFRAITSMYGAVHCASQVVRRRRPDAE